MRGFTLVEVVVSLTIAAVGGTMLHQGVMQALRAEEKRRWYEACALYLDRSLDRALVSGESYAGAFEEARGLPLTVQVEVEAKAADMPDAVDLRRAVVTFRGPRGFTAGPCVAYFTPRLRARDPAEVGP